VRSTPPGRSPVVADHVPVPKDGHQDSVRDGRAEQAAGAVPDMANAGAAMATTGRDTCGRMRNDISEIPALGKRRGRCHDLAAFGGPDGFDKPIGR